MRPWFRIWWRVKDKKTNEGIEKQRQEQEYRQLTLRFSMPASEFKVMQSDAGQYAARLLISAVGYADGKLASSNGGQWEQVIENFNGAADPRIAMSTITATLTLNVLEHGKDRWLLANVRDLATGQFGSMVIPMGRVKGLRAGTVEFCLGVGRLGGARPEGSVVSAAYWTTNLSTADHQKPDPRSLGPDPLS